MAWIVTMAGSERGVHGVFVFLVQMELRDDSVISWDGVGKGVRCYQHYTLCLEAEFLTKDQQKDRKKHLSFPVFHNRLVLQ